MLGAIVGDIAGSAYEFHRTKNYDFPMFPEGSKFTDDTVLTLTVAKAVNEGYGDTEKTKQILTSSLVAMCDRFPFCGWGARFYRWALMGGGEPYGSFGNGSAMRVSSVSYAYDTIEEVERFATATAEVTHNHPEGIKGACAVASAIFFARKGKSKDFIKDFIVSRYGYDLTRKLSDIRPTYKFEESCQKSIPEAITCFLEADSFESTIRNAISLGGDADTQANMAGAIADAFYKNDPERWIPKEWQDKALDLLDPYLLDLYKEYSK